MITIIDYAINNLRSVEKAFLSMNIAVRVSDDPNTCLLYTSDAADE